MPGLVLDPFLGTGTTALVAEKHGRDWLGIELNATYAAIAEDRLSQQRQRTRQADSRSVLRSEPRRAA